MTPHSSAPWIPRMEKMMPPQGALRGRHRDIALHRRAHHRGELAEKMVLVGFAERHRALDALGQLRPVSQQEEQQVQHDGEADHELEGVLPDAERLGRQELAGLHRAGAELFLQAGDVGQVEPRQQVMHGRRQRFHGLLEVGAKVDLAGFDALVQVRPLAHQRPTDDHQRQDHQQQHHGQRDQRRQVAPAADARHQPPLQRREQDGQDGAPEHRAVERPQQPAERDGYHHQEEQEGTVVQAGRLAHVPSKARPEPRRPALYKAASRPARFPRWPRPGPSGGRHCAESGARPAFRARRRPPATPRRGRPPAPATGRSGPAGADSVHAAATAWRPWPAHPRA